MQILTKINCVIVRVYGFCQIRICGIENNDIWKVVPFQLDRPFTITKLLSQCSLAIVPA